MHFTRNTMTMLIKDWKFDNQFLFRLYLEQYSRELGLEFRISNPNKIVPFKLDIRASLQEVGVYISVYYL